MRPLRNLFVFHLESIGWQAVRSFPEAFPNLHALMATARTFPAYFSSSTSTQMVLAAFLHANDFERDAKQGLSRPAGNNPSLLKTLEEIGYCTAFLCATSYPSLRMLPQFSDSVPPVWSTNDYSQVIRQFEAHVEAQPFAIYVWSQVPHAIANMALASYARHIDGLFAGACAAVDNLLGALLEVLRRSGREDETTVVVYGDHGDDFYTHGFNSGLLHAGPPFTPLVHVPLVIRDRLMPVGRDRRLVSTIDLAPTCLDLLGLGRPQPFPYSGQSLLQSEARSVAFSQNLTANQARVGPRGPRRYFAANDHSYTLLVGPRGLEFYNFRMDPTNHFNILHFFNISSRDELELFDPPFATHRHFETVRHMWRGGGMQETFAILFKSLKDHVAAKNAYATERAEGRLNLMDLDVFRRINRTGWEEFFRAPRWIGPRVGGRLQKWRLRQTDINEVMRGFARRLRDVVGSLRNQER